MRDKKEVAFEEILFRKEFRDIKTYNLHPK